MQNLDAEQTKNVSDRLNRILDVNENTTITYAASCEENIQDAQRIEKSV